MSEQNLVLPFIGSNTRGGPILRLTATPDGIAHVCSVLARRSGSTEKQREAARPVIAGDAASEDIDRGQRNGRDGIRLIGRLPTPFFPNMNRSTRE